MSFLNQAILNIGYVFIASAAMWGISAATPPKELEKKVSTVANEAFSNTGEITQKQRLWSETVNPPYALFNCQRTSAATAQMLETGAMNPVSIQPVAFCSSSNMEKCFPEVFQNISEARGCFRTSCKKEQLDLIMAFLGQGTHAIISVSNKLFSNAGHLFNYALVKTEEGCRFEIIESYGGSYTKKARENPHDFFDGYDSQIEVIVFYNKTTGKSSHIQEIMKGLPVEHLTHPSTTTS